MYKTYYTGEDVMEYYVSFRTEDINQNITIIPIIPMYLSIKASILNLRNYLRPLSYSFPLHIPKFCVHPILFHPEYCLILDFSETRCCQQPQ